MTHLVITGHDRTVPAAGSRWEPGGQRSRKGHGAAWAKMLSWGMHSPCTGTSQIQLFFCNDL